MSELFRFVSSFRCDLSYLYTFQLTRSAEIEKKIFWLRSRLSRSPFWINGHLEYAQLSLQCDNVAAAYPSLLAVLELGAKGRVAIEAKRMLGTSYLRRGLNEQACAYFEEVIKARPERFDVKEELAAALMAMRSYKRAGSLLTEIGVDRLSAPARMALSYCEQKLDENNRE